MADAASILAPPDPTWNPPQQSTGNIPETVPPVQQSVDVTTPQNAPVATIPAQDTSLIQPQPTPSQVPMGRPPDDGSSDHLNWLKRRMNSALSILAGDETWHVHKDEVGHVSVTADPSTQREKWGRIAAAVIGGAAHGIAAGQGPGGLAKAAAAGTEYGMQLPQQLQQQATQQGAAQQEQMMRQANIVALNQRNAISAFQLADMKAKGTEADLTQEAQLHDWLRAGGGNAKVAHFTNPEDARKYMQGNQQAMTLHTDGRYMPVVSHDPKSGAITGIDVYQTDPGWGDQKSPAYTINQKQIQNGELVDNPIGVPSDTHTNNERMAQQQAVTAQNNDLSIKLLNAQKGQDKLPTNPLQARVQAANEPDPVKRQALLDAATQAERQQINVKATQPGGGAATGAEAGAATVRAGGGTAEDALANIPDADRATVRAIGEGRMSPPSRFTKEGGRLMGMVNAVYPDYDAAQYPTYQATRRAFTSGTAGTGLNFIRTSRNHLNELEANLPNNVTIPVIGSAINWAKNTALRATNPQLRAFEAAREAVSSEVGKAYAGKAITQGEHDSMLQLINESDSPGALRGGIDEFRRLLTGKLQGYRDQWNSGMPRGSVSPLSTLENLETETPAAAPAGATRTAPPPSAPPSGPTFDARVWSNVKGVTDTQRIQQAVDEARRRGMIVSNLPTGVR